MKRVMYERWLKELETAPKTTGCLKDDKGMCCLGVLCSLHEGIEFKGAFAFDTEYKGVKTGLKLIMPKNLTDELGMSNEVIKALAGLYDTTDTFTPVINHLRENEGRLFPIEGDCT